MLNAAWTVIKQAWDEFGRDEAGARAAALAFYTALGMAPMLLLTIAIASFLPEGVEQRMIQEISSIVALHQPETVEAPPNGAPDPGQPTGDDVAGVIDEMVEHAQKKQREMSAGTWSLVVGVVTLLFSASGVFAELQIALNKMWDLQTRPSAGILEWLQKRLLSLGMLIGILFIMLVSLGVSTAISAILPQEGTPWGWVNAGVSLALFVVIFALIYKVLPDAKIAWRDVWIGAAFTAILFAVGKQIIAYYLGSQSFTSSYGAAGSLIALLVWIYYSSLIVFFGAEMTQVFARRYGSGIQPDAYAQRIHAPHKEKPEGKTEPDASDV